MNTKIRLPNITSGNEAEQLRQVKSYLYQMVEQLNIALEGVGAGPAGTTTTATKTAAAKVPTEQEALSNFNSIKALIIKSADIVNAYYEEINRRLEGVYVAESDFGTYAQQTAVDIQENSEGISRNYTNIQQILSDIAGINQRIEVSAYTRDGLLYTDDNGIPIYGFEVGQTNVVDGVETFNQFARFTAARLSFFDRNGNECAYVSDRKLEIPIARIVILEMGGFDDTVQSDGSIVTKWVGTGG